MTVRDAEGFVDEELRIDLIVVKGEAELCGIQVKPHTFDYIRSEVISYSLAANKTSGKPVFYLKYSDDEMFVNLEEVVQLVSARAML